MSTSIHNDNNDDHVATTSCTDNESNKKSIIQRINEMSSENNNNDYDDDTTTTTTTIWSNRLLLQNSLTLIEKGWQVAVIWKESIHCGSSGGIGVFANQFITAGTILRIGIIHTNLLQFQSISDIELFCQHGGGGGGGQQQQQRSTTTQYTTRLLYVQDYLWGYYPSIYTNERGYLLSKTNPINENENDETHRTTGSTTTTTTTTTTTDIDDTRFFGMWIPGNGLNHNTIPNTVYRNYYTTTGTTDGSNSTTTTTPITRIDLIALTDIVAGEELYDDYHRHGPKAPQWLYQYAQQHHVTLNFANCNNFVL